MIAIVGDLLALREWNRKHDFALQAGSSIRRPPALLGQVHSDPGGGDRIQQKDVATCSAGQHRHEMHLSSGTTNLEGAGHSSEAEGRIKGEGWATQASAATDERDGAYDSHPALQSHTAAEDTDDPLRLNRDSLPVPRQPRGGGREVGLETAAVEGGAGSERTGDEGSRGSDEEAMRAHPSQGKAERRSWEATGAREPRIESAGPNRYGAVPAEPAHPASRLSLRVPTLPEVVPLSSYCLAQSLSHQQTGKGCLNHAEC